MRSRNCTGRGGATAVSTGIRYGAMTMFIFAWASATASRAAPASALGTMLASSMRRLQPAAWVRYTTCPVLRSLAVTSCGWLVSLGALALVGFPFTVADWESGG